MPFKFRSKPLLSVLVIVVLIGAACSREAPPATPLVLYSDIDAQVLAKLTAPFTELTGIPVSVSAAVDKGFAGSGGQSIDVVLAADAAALAAPDFIEQLLPLQSVVLETNIADPWRGVDNRLIGLAVNAAVLVYQPERVAAAELTGLQELALPAWRNRLCLPMATDPGFVSAAATLLAAHGEVALQSAAAGWYANSAAPPATLEQNAAAVAAGSCDVTLAHSELFAKLQSENPKQPLRLHWPQPGVAARVITGAVLRSSTQPQQAQKLIEYLSTAAAQADLARLTRTYPVHARAVLPPQLANYGQPRFDGVTLAQILAQLPAARAQLQAAESASL